MRRKEKKRERWVMTKGIVNKCSIARSNTGLAEDGGKY